MCLVYYVVVIKVGLFFLVVMDELEILVNTYVELIR